MKSWYDGLVEAGSQCQSFLLLVIRLFWGYQFLVSGWGKLHSIENVSSFFHDLGIPFAETNAYIAAGVEFVGGILLILGLASRLVAIPLAFTMVVAYLTAHWDATSHLFSNPIDFIEQPPFTFLLATLLIFTFGPGTFSLDYLIERFFLKKTRRK